MNIIEMLIHICHLNKYPIIPTTTKYISDNEYVAYAILLSAAFFFSQQHCPFGNIETSLKVNGEHTKKPKTMYKHKQTVRKLNAHN